MFWREEKKIRLFHECHAIFDFLGKWLLRPFLESTRPTRYGLQRVEHDSYPNQKTSRVRTKDLSLVLTTSINGSHRARRSHATYALTQMTWWKGNRGGRRLNLMQPQISSSLKRWWPSSMIRVISHGWVSGWMLQPTALLVFWSYVNSLPLLKTTLRSRMEHQLTMM